jgi:formylglycine-generating enzyme required for sulfatase activity
MNTKSIITILFTVLIAKAQISVPLSYVGDPGNAASSQSSGRFGSVGYSYHIGTYEITNDQYAAFLNAVASIDTNEVWNSGMKISRSGANGSYSYTVQSGFSNAPVTWVSYFSALRFANWLNNGQPRGFQSPTITEDGAYTFSAKFVASSRKLGAKVFIPNENEWFKSGYYQSALLGGPPGNYWLYATMTNTTPSNNRLTPKSVVYDNYSSLQNVGSCSLSPGPWGTYDQNGNAHELLEEPGFTRGGFFSSAWSTLETGSRNIYGISQTEGYHYIGFRVAASSSILPYQNSSGSVSFTPAISQAVCIKWNSEVSQSYVVERSQDLISWSPASEVITGTGGQLVRYYELDSSANFFRIKKN